MVGTSFRWHAHCHSTGGQRFHVAAINGGRHVAPLFAGDTVFAWSEVIASAETAEPQRRRSVAFADNRNKGSSLRKFPAQERRRL